jgi:Ca2+-binding EF-hand superfamily protein
MRTENADQSTMNFEDVRIKRQEDGVSRPEAPDLCYLALAESKTVSASNSPPQRTETKDDATNQRRTEAQNTPIAEHPARPARTNVLNDTKDCTANDFAQQAAFFHFDKFDLNKDGRLTEGELRSGVQFNSEDYSKDQITVARMVAADLLYKVREHGDRFSVEIVPFTRREGKFTKTIDLPVERWGYDRASIINKLSEREVNKDRNCSQFLRANFDALDRNGDKVLDEQELLEGQLPVPKTYKQAQSYHEANDIFKQKSVQSYYRIERLGHQNREHWYVTKEDLNNIDQGKTKHPLDLKVDIPIGREQNAANFLGDNFANIDANSDRMISEDELRTAHLALPKTLREAENYKTNDAAFAENAKKALEIISRIGFQKDGKWYVNEDSLARFRSKPARSQKS